MRRDPFPDGYRVVITVPGGSFDELQAIADVVRLRFAERPDQEVVVRVERLPPRRLRVVPDPRE